MAPMITFVPSLARTGRRGEHAASLPSPLALHLAAIAPPHLL